jgi:LPXTG-motif cell wall-anchored protein
MIRRLSSGSIFAAIMLVLAALAPSAGAAPRTAVNTPVTIQNFAFGPKTIAIHVGDTVTWTNSDTAPHTATALDKSFDSGRLEQGQTFAFTFTKAGTFDYICSFHESMTAKVEVMDMSAPAAPAAPAGQAPSGSLDASDQPLADGGVTVAKVNSSVAGWVVVHLNENNAPGKVLGQTAVPAGDSSNVVVKLSENVPVGGKVWPMLHIDAGAAGTYEFPGADVPVKVGDNIVMKQITITDAAAAPAVPAAPAAPPANLPNTGGEDVTLSLVGGALALLALGALGRRRMRK